MQQLAAQSSGAVYVVGGSYRTGGAQMARRIGQLAASLTGGELVDVPIDPVDLERWPMHPAFARAELVTQIKTTPEDVLIVNPSFSNLHIATRFSGRKIMFAQNWCTTACLDQPFDLIIASSPVVRNWLQSVWGIRPRIIAPFAAPPESGGGDADADLLVYLKNNQNGETLLWTDLYKPALEERGISYSVLSGSEMPQAEFFAALQRHRGALFLQLSEGFGLAPLESAMLGVTPFGFDGAGGRAYARRLPRRTLHPWPRHDLVLQSLDGFRADRAAFRLPQKFRERLRARYSRERFDRQWLRALRRVLR